MEKYLTIFEHKIDFFKAYIFYNNIKHALEIFYLSKKELKGSRIVLKCTSIKLSHLKKTYNVVFEKQNLRSILLIMAGEIGLDGLTLDSTLENVKISKLEQGNKTNLDILKELCEFFYSYITSQDEKLIFLKKSNLRADSYRLLILDNLVISISKKDSKYKIYNGVQCSWYSTTTKKNELMEIGQKPYLTQKSLHNQQLSELLLRSKYEQIKEKELIELIIYVACHF